MPQAPKFPPPADPPKWNVTFPHAYLMRDTDEATKLEKWNKGLCVSRGCRRYVEKGRTRCATCRCRLNRMRDELGYVFGLVRKSAAKRGIEFALSKAEFRDFCRRTNYLTRRGVGDGRMTIDRINHARGYEAGNIQIKEWRENVTHVGETTIDPDCPFGPP